MEVIRDSKELLLLACLVLWVLVRHAQSDPWLPWLGALLALAFSVEISAKLLGHYGLNNHLLYNAYLLLEFALVVLMVRSLWPENRLMNRLILGASLIFVCVLVWDLRAHGTLRILATNALIVGGFLLGSIAVLALFRLANLSPVPLTRRPLFWVLLSIMIFFLTFIPIFGLYNHLSAQASPIAGRLGDFIAVLFVIRYGLVLVGLVVLQRQGRRRAP